MPALLFLAVPFICIVVIAVFYAVSFDRKVNETFFLSSVTIIFLLYTCGLFNFKGSLLVGYALVVIIVLYALLYIRKKYLQEDGIFGRISLKTGIITFIIFLIIALLLNYGRLFYVWDEFTHWGSVVKHMYLFDALGTLPQSTIPNKAYLPGTSLFQYFWVRPFPEFIEYPAFVASNMLFFSLVATFMTRLNYKTISISAIFLLVPLTFDYNHYNTLYVDSFLGVFFGAAILFYFYFRYEESIYAMLMVSATIGMLTITKEAGFIFSLVLLTIIAFDLKLYRKEEVKTFLANAQSRLGRVRNIMLLAGPVVVFIFVQLSWRLLLMSRAIKSPSSGISLQRLFSLRDDILPYQVEVIDSFKAALYNRPLLPFGLSYLHIVAAIVLIGLVVFYLSKRGLNLKRQITVIVLCLLGSILYIAARFMVYLLVFGQTAGPQLASFERYIISYMSGIFVALPIFFTELTDKNLNLKTYFSRKYNKACLTGSAVAAIAIIMLVMFLLPANLKERLGAAPIYVASRLSGIAIETTIEERESFNNLLKWSDYLDRSKNYYLVAQGHRGYSMRAFNYILYPHVVFRNYGHVEPPLSGGNANQWGNYILEYYDFLYLFEADQVFADSFGHFFDYLAENMLYEVTAGANGELLLIAMKE